MLRTLALVATPVVIAASNVTGASLLVLSDEEFAERYSKWEQLYFGQNGPKPATCSNDMRRSMPPCKQKGDMWCWATGVSELTAYYKGSNSTCDGMECKVVGWCPTWDGIGPFMKQHCSTKHIECCPYSAHADYCGGLGATFGMLADAATHFTGRQHGFYNGPMPQHILDATLAEGIPMLMVIGENGTGSHVTSIAGCGGGMYFYHDPETSVFNTVDYNALLKPDERVWIDTIYATSGASVVIV